MKDCGHDFGCPHFGFFQVSLKELDPVNHPGVCDSWQYVEGTGESPHRDLAHTSARRYHA